MSSHNEYKLIQEIISRSNAETWDEAKREWSLLEVYREDDPLTCLCTHFPINEICVLRNRQNGNEAIVGNVCVKKFLGLPSDKIFAGIGRIAKDIGRALNADTILHAYERGWITEWEKKFYLDTWRKKSLTEKQRQKRVQINERVLRNASNKFRARGGR
jgi:hypothetical protein